MIKSVYFFAFLLLCMSCDKLDELTKFNIDYATEVTVPSSTGINLPFDIFTPDTETNSESKFESNDTRKDLIEEIKLTELKLEIKSPNGADFSFLEAIEVFISADGIDEIKIASKTDVSETATTIDLDIVDVDLQEYIKADSYNLRLNTITDEAMSSDHIIEVNSKFFVDAKILGL